MTCSQQYVVRDMLSAAFCQRHVIRDMQLMACRRLPVVSGILLATCSFVTQRKKTVKFMQFFKKPSNLLKKVLQNFPNFLPAAGFFSLLRY